MQESKYIVLARATAGIAGSNACGDEEISSSEKQEAAPSGCGDSLAFKCKLSTSEVKAMAAPNSAPVALGDVLNVTIDTAGPHGQGIVHLENFIIFVQNCPQAGAKAKVKITHLGRTYANAQRVG